MKTRKQQTPVRKRAQRRPPADATARRRSAAARAKAARAGLAELTLPVECTLAEAESLKSELASRLQHLGPVTLDAGALRRIDTAGLQLLAAFVRDRRLAGRAVEWRGCAGALQSAAALLGLEPMLELAAEAGR